MKPDATREYELDGLRLQVTLRYDETTGRYFEEFPDFEESPMYTARGKPIVCAAQDACLHGDCGAQSRCLDCGSCGYFQPLYSDELLGTCDHPARKKRPTS